MDYLDKDTHKIDLIHETIEQLMEERRSKKSPDEEDEETILLSRLLSQLDTMEKDSETRNTLICPLEKEESTHNETGDCSIKEAERVDEIVREIKTLKRQNVITHCLLSVLIIVTAVWQFSEASLLLNMKEKVTHPVRAVGDLVTGAFKGKGKKHAIEAPPLPPISVPELPHLDLPHLPLEGGRDK